MSPKSFILQSLFMLLFCTSFLSAADPFGLHISKYRKVEAYVGFRDYGHNTHVTPQFLVSEAKKFWDFLPQEGGPGMVSALSTGNGQIYFASSIIGTSQDGNMGFPSLITSALDACIVEQDGRGTHIFNGRCAELMVIAEWLLQNGGGHPDSHAQLPTSGKLIVAVDYKRKVRRPCSWYDDPEHYDPCAYGCANVLPELGFNPGEIVNTDPTTASEDPIASHVGPRGLTERACVPKKPTTKPRGKPAPQGKSAPPKKPKARSNRGPKPAPPKMLAPKAWSNRGRGPPKPRLPAKPKARSNKGPKH